MRVQPLSRAIAWLTIVVILVLALTGPHIPGWLSGVAVVSALALGIPSGLRQGRRERAAVRQLWRARRRPAPR